METKDLDHIKKIPEIENLTEGKVLSKKERAKPHQKGTSWKHYFSTANNIKELTVESG